MVSFSFIILYEYQLFKLHIEMINHNLMLKKIIAPYLWKSFVLVDHQLE